jgi:uncharacterized protein (TIGR03089 family)
MAGEPTLGAVTTFASLLQDLHRRDAGRPLVTFYDDATGERVGLSVATYANWVAKTASLLVDELDVGRGDRMSVRLPTHWLGPVFLGAAWTAGMSVVDDQDAEVLVVGPDDVEGAASSGGHVLACALLPMGVRFAAPVPAGVHDFGLEVWSQPDAFLPHDPATPDDEAVPGRSQAELLAGPGVADRLLSRESPVSGEGLTTFVQTLVGGGSTVWVRNPDPALWDRHREQERASSGP